MFVPENICPDTYYILHDEPLIHMTKELAGIPILAESDPKAKLHVQLNQAFFFFFPSPA